MLHEDKELSNDSARLSIYNNFTDKKKMAAAKKQRFLHFLYWTESSPTVIQSPRFTNDHKFGINVNTYQ